MVKPDPALSWSFAQPGWEERLRAGKSLMPDLPLDEEAATRAVQIFNQLRVYDMLDQPPLEQAGQDWQREIIAAIFGSIDEQGRRRVAELFLLVPKKNWKTGLGAAIMIVALILNKRPNAEFTLIGPTKDTARRAYKAVVGMIEADEDPEFSLRDLFKITEHEMAVQHRKTGAQLVVKSFDTKIVTGSVTAGVLIDELHEMGTMQRAEDVIIQLRGGSFSVPERFLVFITTQSVDPPAGVFRQELDYARKVRDGKIKGSAMLPILYEFPLAMQLDVQEPWQDPETWSYVTPNLGASVPLDRMVQDAARAKEVGDGAWQKWLTQHLNIEVGIAYHADRWLAADYWADAADPTLTLHSLIERSEVCVIGIDGGGEDDLFGVSVCGREAETDNWLFWAHAYFVRTRAEVRKQIASRLEDFVRQGDLTEVRVTIDAMPLIMEIVEKIRVAGKLPQTDWIGMDGVLRGQVTDVLAQRGFSPDVVRFVNPYAHMMASAVYSIEGKLLGNALAHNDASMLDWCIGNVKADKSGTCTRIKKKTPASKIDPIIAVINAAKLMEDHPEAAQPSASSIFDNADAIAKIQSIYA